MSPKNAMLQLLLYTVMFSKEVKKGGNTIIESFIVTNIFTILILFILSHGFDYFVRCHILAPIYCSIPSHSLCFIISSFLCDKVNNATL